MPQPSLVALATRRLMLIIVAAYALGAQAPRYSVDRQAAGVAGSPEVAVIRDEAGGLEAAVAPGEGGELTSLRVRFRGAWVELIHRARDYGSAAGFRGKAQFLWPATGGQYLAGTTPAGMCVDGSYLLRDRTYPMPCHGFAKSLAWRLTEHAAGEDGAQVTVELRDSGKTRAAYPFNFVVRATYRISGGRLAIVYTVSAGTGNSGPMPFSIGNHLSLRLPFLAGTNPAEMLFESPSTVELIRDSRRMLTGEQRARSFAAPKRMGNFDATVALPLAGYQGAAYARVVDPQGLALRITHRPSKALPEPVVQFNVYGGPQQGFICPEPWYGLQNSLNLGKGLIQLAPGGEWRWMVELQPEGAGVEGRR